MVAQTKADARNGAARPDQANKKWLQKDAAIDSRENLDEQATAAAVVDAEQAQAVAANAVPTEAPGIGLMAQTTTTTTDTPLDTTTTNAVETTPPPVAEESTGVNPWVVGGAALLGVGAVVAIADNNDDDDPNPVGDNPAPVPPPVVPGPGPAPAPGPGPAPVPAPVPPTSTNPNSVVAEADGSTALSSANFPFTPGEPGDTLTSVRIGSITPTNVDVAASPALAVDAATGHGYELIQAADPTAGLTWDQASAIAASKGGYLAVLNSEAEMTVIQEAFSGLGPEGGEGGAWIGLRQAANSPAPDAGWTWLDGSPLPAESPLWSSAFGGALPADFSEANESFGTENNEANFGAIYEGATATDIGLIYDRGSAPPHAPTGSDTLPQFLVEYNSLGLTLTATPGDPLTARPVTPGETIQAADLGKLSWNSVFNTGGAVNFAVGDPQGDYSTPQNTLRIDPTPAAPVVTSLASMIDDQSAGNFV